MKNFSIASLSRLLLLPGLLLGVSLGACAEDEECSAGSEDCACVLGQCLDGLTCLNNVCYSIGGTGPGDGDGETGGDGDTGDGDGDTGGCDAGQSSCNGVCIDTSGDPANCGGCNVACDEGQACDGGSCTAIADCTVEPCPGSSYCDLASKQCQPGCAFDNQCAGDLVCDLASHECGCPVDTSDCDGQCIPDWEECVICGNGTVEGDEDCDGNNLNGATCTSFGFDSGTLSCSGCVFNTGNCENDDPDPGELADDFESGNLLTLPWMTSAPAWTVSTTTPYQGSYSAASGTITHNGTTSLGLTLNVPAGQVRFWHRESTESGYDNVGFYIDNVQMGMWSGLNSWTQATYPVTAGVHTFSWRYTKDGSDNAGEDRVYIDNVSFGP